MKRTRSLSVSELHRSWLELVDTDGPFLSVPALKRVWSQGMPQPQRDALAVLRDAKPAFEKAWENWDKRPDDEAALEFYRQERDSWVDVVLRDVIGWDSSYGTDIPDEVKPVRSPRHEVTVRPTGMMTHGPLTGALVLVIDPVASLRDAPGDSWNASPVDRMGELLRANGVEIGIVTDGRWWALVSALSDTMLSSGIVDAQTWIEEPETRNAFFALLARRRLVGGKESDRLPKVFAESVAAAEEITDALGVQVRRAVELLVQAMSESALDDVRQGNPNPLPDDRDVVYEAAVTLMMRVVFLLFAEERELLPNSRLFMQGYGIAGQFDELDARAREEGVESLDATSLCWHRLLATSRALYGGSTYEDVRVPAYGGSLFDPHRFGFLSRRNEHGGLMIAISDRVMLEVLRSVQMAQLRRGESARRISFRDIDVEQIGYIYEGLLGYTCEETDAHVVGLIGKNGEEPEIPLARLEELAQQHPDPTKLAAAVLKYVADTQPAAKPPTKSALAKAIRAGEEIEDAERALRAVTMDAQLRERLRPFLGMIRRDLRERPYVVMPGGVLVAETASRSSAGAHYTPKWLAEEVVTHALEPLVYQPGPHQTPDRDAWRLIASDEILDLKVADIACGSGAFLVAAARFLSNRLAEAYRDEGIHIGQAHEFQTRAVREVIAKCLYGADINPMAVEMCKLSLWLVSLDRTQPFSFVDDKILCGNSLLGLTDERQLKKRNIDPDAEMPPQTLFEIDVDGLLRRAARKRDSLASDVTENDPQRSLATKRRLWKEYRELTAPAAELADGVVAAGLRLGGKPGKQLREAYTSLHYALERAAEDNGQPDRGMLEEILESGLTPQVDTDYARWRPLHWILAVPDVMERGGFDAIIGNPPFLGGQKLTGTMGTNVRDWFVHTLAGGKKGSADLVAYFLLRAADLLNERGNLGLIATSTLAQGDTREIGLDRLMSEDFTLTRAVQSAKWPSASASLEYAAVWGTRAAVAENIPRVADGVETKRISTLLEAAGKVDGVPARLPKNADMAFQGCIVLGMGFVLEEAEAREWIVAEPRNAEVLFPYLNGQDLNSRPDASPARWVIDFNDRAEAAACEYALPYARVEERVKPERAKNNRAVRRERWWQFAELSRGMRAAIAGLDEVLVIALVSSTVMPIRVRTDTVFSNTLGVFATDSYVDQAVLSSSLHQLWAIRNGSTIGAGAGVRYTPSDVFETLPRPEPTPELEAVGRTLDIERREIMLRRELGLTKLYNLVNDPDVPDADADVARLRAIHVELDETVMAAYGWSDVPLDHGFHTYRQMQRWMMNQDARIEVFDRLLAENLRRAEEQGVADTEGTQ